MKPDNNKNEMNNKVIILRKHLKSTLNIEKLNFAKKTKKLTQNKKHDQIVARRESELECFKRVKVTDIPLSKGVHSEELKKTLTNPNSNIIDRIYARVLLHRQVQEVIVGLKADYGVECVENFLKTNGESIQNNLANKSGKKSTTKAKKEGRSSDKNDIKDIHDLDKEQPVELKESATLRSRKKSIKDKNMSIEGPGLKEEQSCLLDVKTKSKKSVDAFFLNPSGDNYYASVRAVDSSNSESEDTKIKKPALKNRKKLATVHASAKPVIKNIVKQSAPETEPSASLIHPSWKAKADMRKSQIQAFAGTKIKFDE